MKGRRVLLIIVVIAAVAASIGIYMKRENGKTEPKYRTEVAEVGSVAETVAATGTISAVTTVQVGSQVSGIVAKLYADYNSPVKKGQLLAELDPTPFQQQVEQRQADLLGAQVQVRNAEIQFERTKRLVQEQLTPQADYDTSKAAYDAAVAQAAQSEASLKQARTNLSYTKIFSPIDGIVVARQYDVGQTVAASFQAPTLFTIAEDLTKMQVQADVDQSDISRVSVGQTARFTVDAYADEPFSGQISQIRLNATQNQNVITYPVMIDVPNPDAKLKPKMTADVTIEVARVADVLRVPNSALRFRPIETAATAGGGGNAGAPKQGAGNGFSKAASALGEAAGGAAPKRAQTVYVLDASGEPKATQVRTGISDGRFTAIVSGDLKQGDRVVTGLATARAEQSGAGVPGMTPGRGPGGGGRRF
ncbi:MAG TPA: efflux RND transporter periplasmic adaptor subunit [Candidatus Polarisedimenticolaceae bacterium]|nr:efflux RND transporter periplasmic adaptor subunit [Candidatus Polarisedimenticolaceae bacterium]